MTKTFFSERTDNLAQKSEISTVCLLNMSLQGDFNAEPQLQQI